MNLLSCIIILVHDLSLSHIDSTKIEDFTKRNMGTLKAALYCLKAYYS